MTATHAAASRRPRGDRIPMSAWRLEWLRLTRSPRWLALAGVYVFFGLLEPVMTRYMQQIVSRVGSGMKVVLPAPTPATAITGYVNQASQTALVVVVVVAAAALSFDARPGVSLFLRTRAAGMWQIVAPRFAVSTAAALAAYALGTLAAWYETALLLGAPPAGPMLTGLICEWVYLVFAVAVVAAASSIARGTLGVVGLALAALLLLPVLGTIGQVHDWLPSTLVNAPAELLAGGQFTDFVPALTMAVATGALLLAVTVARLRAREL
jgi:ABC-2 type transport system permease protein